MQPIINALEEIINDIGDYDMEPLDRFVATNLLACITYLLQRAERKPDGPTQVQ